MNYMLFCSLRNVCFSEKIFKSSKPFGENKVPYLHCPVAMIP